MGRSARRPRASWSVAEDLAQRRLLLLGAAAVAIGIAVLYGQTWALGTGILVAILSAVANFAFIPYYPVWAILVIAVDVAAIWALSSLLRNT